MILMFLVAYIPISTSQLLLEKVEIVVFSSYIIIWETNIKF